MSSHHSIPPMRRSACAAQSRAAELERLRKMSVEERIKMALTLDQRFAWLKPAPRAQDS